MRRLVLTCLIAPVVLLAACGGGSKSTSSNPRSSAPASAQRSAPGGCEHAALPPPRSAVTRPKPKLRLDPHRRWTLTVETNCGDFGIAVDVKDSPHAAASMVTLARTGFFKDTIVHRIAPGYVIQAGDPTQTGDGDPGYTTVDRPPPSTRYTLGVAAMAKSDSDPAGAGGSQFFIVTGADAQLPPDYAILGRVTKGLGVVERIGRLGDQSERPTQPVVIHDIRAGL